MKAILSLLLGMSSSSSRVMQNPYDALMMEEAWKQEITLDWHSLDHAASWENWKSEFGKTYSSLTEEGEAFIKFLDNWKMINDFNAEGEHTYTLRMNQFGDMTGDEFKLYVHGHSGSCLKNRPVADRVSMTERSATLEELSTVPDSIDWTDIDGESYVTAVKNQGSCGSCWAFSTTGSIESRYAIKHSVTGDSITTLSEQQLVDCSSSYGNLGCNGGLMDYAFEYVIATGGLCSEAEYAYTAETGRKCLADECSTLYDSISSYTDVTSDSSTDLKAAVAEGPVSIAIEADQTSFQFYSSGVLTGLCGDRLDHGVLVVGYGTEDGTEFWKVKNSWGDTWGMDGYVLLCRDCDANRGAGECGILMEPSYPVAN